MVEDLLARDGPFDQPVPTLKFPGRRFMFTGKFTFGSRTKCRETVVQLGGQAPDTNEISLTFDYLVVGSGGSKAWVHGNYGVKICEAVMLRQK